MFSLGLAFLLVTNFLDAIYPVFLKKGLDQISSQASKSDFLFTAGQFFLILAGLAVTRYLWRVYFGTYHTKAAEELRNTLFKHICQQRPDFFNRNPSGELMSLLVNDIQSFRNAIGSGLLILVDGLMILVMIIPLMLMLNPTWTWQTLILIPLVPILIWWVNREIYQRYKLQQDILSKLSGFSQEMIGGIRVIKNFVRENHRLKMYDQISADYRDASIATGKIESFFSPVMQFGVASGTAILLFIAADDLVSGAATIGVFVAFQRYITKAVWPMTALGLGLSQYQKGMASFARIKAIIEEPAVNFYQYPLKLEAFAKLKVSNLKFAYKDQPILKDISFEVHAGQTLGIIGPVGSGKSTLINILAGLLPAPEGTIEINGIPLSNISLHELRQVISVVPQDPFLFSVSIHENLNYGVNKIDEESLKWTKFVDLHDEILSLPNQYESQLGERGINLSGGQKQRLTLARGLARSTPVIILDDVLSAVDVETESRIIANLNDRSQVVTKLIVSHRISSLIKADQIIVLENGSITARGTHQELIKSSKTYQELVHLQEHGDHQS